MTFLFGLGPLCKLIIELFFSKTMWDKKKDSFALKKVPANKLVKSNKSISRKILFDLNPFFAISKMAKNHFLNWENMFLNCQKCKFTKKFFDLFDFTSFFAGLF